MVALCGRTSFLVVVGWELSRRGHVAFWDVLLGGHDEFLLKVSGNLYLRLIVIDLESDCMCCCAGVSVPHRALVFFFI